MALDNEPSKDFAPLLASLGLDRAPTQLIKALTHASYARDNNVESQERLALAGSEALKSVIVDTVYRETVVNAAPESELARMRAWLERADTLAETARAINLGDYLRLGDREEHMGVREGNKNLARAYRAVLGAISTEPSQSFAERHGALTRAVQRTHGDSIRLALNGRYDRNWKAALKAWTRALGVTGWYDLSYSGVEHRRFYTATFTANGKPMTKGQGYSSTRAEMEAARRAVEIYQDMHKSEKPPAKRQPRRRNGPT